MSNTADVVWDPGQYLRYAGQRGRPFEDLLARVDAKNPSYVVDLGCGPGTLTATLVERWPAATIEGVDASPEMIAAARPLTRAGQLTFTLADVRDWAPTRPVDVLLSNAMLQWVPEHVDLLPSLVERLAPGGWLAIQVPGNFGAPSHRILHEVALDARWSGHLADRQPVRPSTPDPEVYLEALMTAGCDTDVWETTYLYLLEGDDPVFEWVKGTGARPILQALPAEERGDFEAACKTRLRQAYPRGPFGTVMPYRRIFVVGRRVDG